MLNLDERSKSKLVWVATLLAPVLAVQGVRFVGHSSGPAAASAAPAPMLPITAAPQEPETPLTPVQARALAWLSEHATELPPRSPMDRPDPDSQTTETRPQQLTPAHGQPAAAAPEPRTDSSVSRYNVSAMLVAERGGKSLARINHKVYCVGDAIAPSWIVRAIDARKRLVVISDPQGRLVELHAPFPSRLEDEADDESGAPAQK